MSANDYETHGHVFTEGDGGELDGSVELDLTGYAIEFRMARPSITLVIPGTVIAPAVPPALSTFKIAFDSSSFVAGARQECTISLTPSGGDPTTGEPFYIDVRAKTDSP